MKSIFYPTLLIFHSVFISLGNDSKLVKYICVILMFFYLINKRRYFLQKKYTGINIWVYLFCASVLCSSLNMQFIKMPLNFHAVSPFSGVLLVMCVLEMFFFMEYIHEIKKTSQFYSLVYQILLFYLIINDVFLLRQMPSVSGQESFEICYLIGNKFVVSYSHIFLSVLYYQRKYPAIQKKELKTIYFFILHFIMAFIAAYLTECSTAIIGCVVLLFLLTFYNKLHFLFKPLGAVLLVFLFCSFFIFYEAVLSIPIVQYLIIDVLHEDLTLTGRTFIYANMLDLMQAQPWFGYGNGMASLFTNYYIKMHNTQNGLLNDYIDWGITGCVFMLTLVFVSVRYANLKSDKNINPFICLLYMYIVLSSIEITMGLMFLVILPLCIFYGKKGQG